MNLDTRHAFEVYERTLDNRIPEPEEDMSMTCTRCYGTGFLNIHQVDDDTRKRFDETGDHQIIIDWAKDHDDHDVRFCDCCGNGDGWYDVAGEHYNSEDPRGPHGPYAYNGGLCECN